jgi:hypothetical protein
MPEAGQWWYTPLIPALGRQRQKDFWVLGQPGLQNEFQDSQGYTEKPCFEKQKKINNKKVFVNTIIITTPSLCILLAIATRIISQCDILFVIKGQSQQ